MRRGVIRLGDEHIVARAIVKRLVLVRNADELVEDGAKELESGCNLLLRLGRLHDRGHNSDVVVSSANVLSRRENSDVDI